MNTSTARAKRKEISVVMSVSPGRPKATAALHAGRRAADVVSWREPPQLPTRLLPGAPVELHRLGQGSRGAAGFNGLEHRVVDTGNVAEAEIPRKEFRHAHLVGGVQHAGRPLAG